MCVCVCFSSLLLRGTKNRVAQCVVVGVCSFLLCTYYPRKQILAKVRKTVEDGTKEEELLRKKKTKHV